MEEETKPAKRGPKPKEQKTNEIERIKECLAKVCHFVGHEKILDEFGIERWKPEAQDMRKYRG